MASGKNYSALILSAIILGSSLVVSRVGVGQTWARFNNTHSAGGNAFATKPDWQPPTTGGAAILNNLGVAGVLRQGGTYQVCASATDGGNPPSGISSVTANLAVSGSVISTGQTAASLSAGSYSCGAGSYNFRSGTLTANGSLSEGSKTYTIAATDGAANSATTSWNVTIDNTPPTATGLQTTNVPGGTAGKAQAGDSVVLTYSEALSLPSVSPGWSGGAMAVTVTINDNVQSYGRDDTVTFSVNLGTIDLGSNIYTIAGSTVFAATMEWSASTNAITITLGSVSGTNHTGTGRSSIANYYPSDLMADLAGNGISTSSSPTEDAVHF